MRKILMLTAALALAATGAQARGKATDISLDGYCNIYHVIVGAGAAGAQDTPSCSGSFGGGLIATEKGFGKSVVLALQDAGNPGVQRMLQLSYPFVTGGLFKLYEATDGTNFHLALDGTYSVIEGAVAKPGKSITSGR
ncbi:MAG TPA: hypothetical protein VG889_11705 [Rhizomicrobium sp.]|nr:hypothetical protein [Rhizomicrobium sp.]